MIHICNHCGAILEDDAKVCSFCGAILEVKNPEPEQPDQTPAEPSMDNTFTYAPLTKKQKKTLIIAGAALLGAILLALATYFLFLGSYHAVAKYESVLDGNYRQLETLAPKEYWEAHAKQNQLSVQEYLHKRMEATKKSAEMVAGNSEEMFGKNYSVSIEVVSTDPVCQEDLSAYKDALQKKYGIDPSRVHAAHHVILKVVQSGTELTYTTSCCVKAIQIDAQWYLMKSTYSAADEGNTVGFLTSGRITELSLY